MTDDELAQIIKALGDRPEIKVLLESTNLRFKYLEERVKNLEENQGG